MKALVIVLTMGVCAGLTVWAEADTREGYVMPTACKSRKAEGGPEAHTTECALELECVVTGYGLWIDGDFFEFDDEGDQNRAEVLSRDEEERPPSCKSRR